LAAHPDAGDVITDVVDHSLDLAKELGAGAVVNSAREDPAARVMAFSGGRGVDIALECAGGKSRDFSPKTTGTWVPRVVFNLCARVPGRAPRVEDNPWHPDRGHGVVRKPLPSIRGGNPREVSKSMPTTLPQATQFARRGGKIVIVGGFDPGKTAIALEWQRIQMSEIQLIPSASFSFWDIHPEQKMCLDLLAAWKLNAKKLITHRFTLEEINEAFETAQHKERTGAVFVAISI
jgi:threonine dehydrogenase-like Zn-dependent dehydrogenase